MAAARNKASEGAALGSNAACPQHRLWSAALRSAVGRRAGRSGRRALEWGASAVGGNGATAAAGTPPARCAARRRCPAAAVQLLGAAAGSGPAAALAPHRHRSRRRRRPSSARQWDHVFQAYAVCEGTSILVPLSAVAPHFYAGAGSAGHDRANSGSTPRVKRERMPCAKSAFIPQEAEGCVDVFCSVGAEPITLWRNAGAEWSLADRVRMRTVGAQHHAADLQYDNVGPGGGYPTGIRNNIAAAVACLSSRLSRSSS